MEAPARREARRATLVADISTERTGADTGDADVKEELLHLADLLDGSPDEVWESASLCEGWRIREVVAHMTMPARYSDDAFMAELAAAGGDFTRVSDMIAARDGLLPASTLVAGLRSQVLHEWQPPGGGAAGALTHCVIHGLDITEALGWDRTVPVDRIGRVLRSVAPVDGPNLFGTDLAGIELQADDIEWSFRFGRQADRPGSGPRPRRLRPEGEAGPPARETGRSLHPLNAACGLWTATSVGARRRRPFACWSTQRLLDSTGGRRGDHPARPASPETSPRRGGGPVGARRLRLRERSECLRTIQVGFRCAGKPSRLLGRTYPAVRTLAGT